MTKKASKKPNDQSVMPEQNGDMAAEVQAVRQRLAECEEREAGSVEQAKRLQSQYRIADAASAVEDMDAFYRTIHEIVGDLIEARNFYIALYDRERKMVNFPYYADEVDPDIPDPNRWDTMGLGEASGLTAYLIRRGAPLRLASKEFLALVEKGEMNLVGTLPIGGVGAPLIVEGNVIGVVVAQTYTEGQGYSEEDLGLLAFAAQHIATALHRARQAEEIQQRNAELAIINSVQSALAAKNDIKGIAEVVGKKIEEIFSEQNVGVGLLDRTSGLFKVHYVVEKGRRYEGIEFPLKKGLVAHMVKTGKTLLIDTDFERHSVELEAISPAEESAPKSWLGVPMIIDGEVIGGISLQNWKRERAYSESDVRLVETLAASMSVALENARLFEEVQTRNTEITEALEQQTAISEVVRALSRAQTDLKVLLEVIAVNAAKVCGADDAHIYRIEGDVLKEWTHKGPIPGLEEGELLPLSRESIIGRAIVDRQTIHVRDAADIDRSEYPISSELQQRWGYQTGLSVPLMRDGEPIGGIAIRREKVDPFTERQIEALQTFADQAVIAIENARLFEETQRQNQQIREALEQQTAIADILRSMAGSPSDIQPVLNVVAQHAAHLCAAQEVAIFQVKDGQMRLAASFDGVTLGPPPEAEIGALLPLNHDSVAGAAILDNHIINVPDLAEEPDDAYPLSRSVQKRHRAFLAVPLMRESQPIGVIFSRRTDPIAFSEHEIELTRAFANQAVIGIENVRLFNETRRLLEETQQRNAELAIINSVQAGLASQLDMQAIYDLVGDKIREIFDAQVVMIMTFDHAERTRRMRYNFEKGQIIRSETVLPFNRLAKHLIETRESVVIAENAQKETKKFGMTTVPGTEESKSLVFVPLVAGGETKGFVSIQNVDRERAFSESDVRLLSTLANSMSIALESARLFDEIGRLLEETQQRNAELAVINTVQEGLASKLELAAIYELVGDKLREIFKADTTYIGFHDDGKTTVDAVYYADREMKGPFERPYGYGTYEAVVESGRPLQFGSEEEANSLDVLPYKVASPGAEKDLNQSVMGAPIYRNGEVIGVASVQSYKKNAYGPNDLRLLLTLASSMSVALENARLFEAEQQRVAELEIINSVQAGLASKLDYQDIVTLVGDKIRDLFETETLYIALVSQSGDMVDFPYWWELDQREAPPPQAVTIGLTGRILQSNESLRLGTDQEQRDLGAVYLPGEVAKQSWLGVPITVGSKSIGVISLQDSKRENLYTESDQRLLQTLASSMGVALENARLFDETTRLLEETQQRNAELAVINSVQRGLASQLDMQAIYALVGDKIREIFDAQSVLILTFDAAARMRRLRYNYEKGQLYTIEEEIPFNELADHLIATKETVVINENAIEEAAKYGMNVTPGTEMAKSMVFVPLVAGGEAKGFVSIQNVDRENAFSESDVRLLSTLANSMSIALESARLFDETTRLLEETQQRNAELAVINSVQRGLASQLDFQAIIDLVGDQLWELFNERTMYIALYDEADDLMHFNYARHEGKRYEPTALALAGFGKVVIETGETIVVNENADAETQKVGSEKLDQSLKSFLSMVFVPILTAGKPTGVISLQNGEREHAYDKPTVRLLESLASSLSVSLENARLFDETKRLLQETQQRNAELAIINSVGQAMAEQLDLQAVTRIVGDKVTEIFQSDATSILLLQAESKMIQPLYELEDGKYVENMEPFPMGKGLTSTVIESRKPLRVDNAEEAAAAGAYYPPEVEATNPTITQSYLGVPIIAGAKLLGVLAVHNYKQDAFDENSERLLSTLSANMGAAMDNARLFDETVRLLEETQQRNAELAIINSVQAGLASKLDFQGIIDLVGDTLRDVFKTGDIGIRTYDKKTNLVHYLYEYEHGERLVIASAPLGGMSKTVVEGRKAILAATPSDLAEVGAVVMPGTDTSKSMVAVPIIVGKEVTGIVTLEAFEEHAFDEADLRLLETLANSMAVALENARLFTETTQRNAELAIINSVQAGLASKLEMQAIYDLVGDRIRDIFDAQVVTINSFDHEAKLNHYRYIIEKGERRFDPPKPYTRVEENLIETAKPWIVLENFKDAIEKFGLRIVGFAPKSGVAVPLLVGGEVTGYVSLQNVDREQAFSESDISLLETLANSMSVALENARLFDELQNRNREISESLERETATREILSVIASSPEDIAPVFEVIAERAAHFAGGDDAIIGIAEGETLIVAAHHGDIPMIPVGEGIPFNRDSVAGLAILDGKPVQAIHNQKGVKSEFPEGDKVAKKYGYRVTSAVPLMREGKAIGAIAIRRTTPELLTDQQVQLLGTFADQAAIAIENVRLFNETRRLLDETQQRNAELAIINSVQAGLASKLDMQAIYELVGDKIHSLFGAETTYIAFANYESQRITFPYYREMGAVIHHDETLTGIPLGKGLTSVVIERAEPLVLNTHEEQVALGMIALPGETPKKSWLGVPITVGKKVIGVIALQDSRHENMYSDSDVRLLSTLASSMGVALENAQLFEETNQRNEELAIINSVQAGLVAQMDMAAIYELVGERVQTIFDAQAVILAGFEEENRQIDFQYVFEKGERFYPRSAQYTEGGVVDRLVSSGKPFKLDTADEFPTGSTIEDTEPSKSGIFVPLRMGGKVSGGISVQNVEREYAFSNDDLRLLSTLAASMSISLESARLFAETQQRNLELATVNHISQVISTELDLDALIQLIGEQMRTSFAADIVYVALHDLQTNMIEFPYSYGQDTPPMRFGEGLTSRILESGEPLLINQDIEARTVELKTQRMGKQAKSYAGVPIIAGKQAIGVISVQSEEEEGRFTDDDVRLLGTIAGNVGTAIANARLYQEIQRRASEMATLAEIGNDIASTRSLEPVLEQIAGRVIEIMQVSDIALYLKEPDKELYKPVVVLGQYVEEIKSQSLAPGQGVGGYVAQTGKGFFANFVEEIPNYSHIPGTPTEEEDPEGLMCAPLLDGSRVIGLITVWRKHELGLFNQHELDFLVSVARQASIAIEGARLYLEIEQRAEEMSALAEIGNDIAATHEIEPVLEKIATRVMNMMNVQDIALYLKEADGKTFRAEVVLGQYVEEIKANPITLGLGIIGDIVRTGTAEFVNVPDADPRTVHIPGTPEIEPDPEGLMAAPLFSGSETIGLIAVWRKHSRGLFSQRELDFLVSVSRQTSIAIESARLYLEIERRAEEMSALAEVGREISATLDLETVMEQIAARARQLLDADNSAVYLPDEASGTLQALVALGDIADEIRESPIRPGEGIIGDMAKRRVAEFVNDVDQDPRGIHIPGTPLDESDEKLMAAPLMSGERLTGMMAVWRSGPGNLFDRDDLNFLIGLARQAAIAIENARLFEDAEEARAAAVQANEAKSTFLANMSHELRTPLNAIIGFTRIVKRKAEGVLAGKQVENLDKVLSSAEHLLGLINTILDIAKIEAGRMDVQAGTFEIGNLVDACVITAQPLVRHGVKLVKELGDDLPPIYSDQDKVKQIVINLLSNASKFTHEGSITISAHKHGNAYQISVRDTGIGISDEALGRVFEEFQQADSSTTRQYGGTGLGLSISRSLARLLGGDLTAESEPEEGSTFTLTLPLRYGESTIGVAEPQPIAARLPRRMKDDKAVVLAIDDDPDAIYLLQESLGEAGYRVVGAMNGDEGIKLARELHPLAITLDVMMPSKDGWQVLYELKADEATKEIPVIMVSIVDKKPMGFRLGAADYLLKPVDAEALQSTLKKLVQINGKPAKRLLVVDDDPKVVDLVSQLLESEHIELSSAADGIAALEAIEAERPDAVLVDLMMPRLDGFGLIDRLLEDPATKDIPIVVLTAKSLTAGESTRLRKSAIQVIEKKGLEADQLIGELQRFFLDESDD